MRYESSKPRFEADGFVVLPQFLTQPEVLELAAELDRYIRDVVPGLSDSHAFYQDRSRPETLKQMQHHGMTIPREEPNRSQSRNRRAFAMVYQGVSCRRDEDRFARYQEAVQKQHQQMGLK